MEFFDKPDIWFVARPMLWMRYRQRGRKMNAIVSYFGRHLFPEQSGTAVLALLTALVLQNSPAHALVITTGCAVPGACTLAELDAGARIQVNDKLFDNWAESSSTVALPGVTLGNAANIIVTGLDDDPSNPGIRFTANGEWSIPQPLPGGSIIFVHSIEFDVSVVGGAATLTDNSLSVVFGAQPGPSTSAGVSEQVFGAAQLNLGEKIVDFSDTFDSIDFAAPQSFLHVEKQVGITAESFSASADIVSVDQRFSQLVAAPEPSALFLFGLGWVLLGAWTWKQRRPGHRLAHLPGCRI
jgi:hypothetical protein